MIIKTMTHFARNIITTAPSTESLLANRSCKLSMCALTLSNQNFPKTKHAFKTFITKPQRDCA